MLSLLKELSPLEALLIFAVNNVLITIMVIVGGNFWQKKVNKAYQPTFRFTARQLCVCVITNILNIGITFLGYYLWKTGWIVLEDSFSWTMIADFFFLIFAMDFLLYLFHVAIHRSALYSLVHGLHHDAKDPDPIDLFVLNPVETISFGIIWILLIMLFPFNIYALVAYITFNILFGLIGHLGVEPFVLKELEKSAFGKYIGTSTFHHDHHLFTDVNYGFYTNIWDRVFGTLKR